MTDKQQPEAFCWATELAMVRDPVTLTVKEAREVSDEMQRMHAENETLRAGYDAARLEIESLQSQLHAAKQINAAQFNLLAASIPGSAMRPPHGQAPAPDERDDFEKVFPLPSGCIRVGTGYASTGYSNWAALEHCERWQGWQASAARHRMVMGIVKGTK